MISPFNGVRIIALQEYPIYRSEAQRAESAFVSGNIISLQCVFRTSA